jgi:hypothetical protein
MKSAIPYHPFIGPYWDVVSFYKQYYIGLIAKILGKAGKVGAALGKALVKLEQIVAEAVGIAVKAGKKADDTLGKLLKALTTKLRQGSKSLLKQMDDIFKKIKAWVDELLGGKSLTKLDIKKIDDAIKKLSIKVEVPKNKLNAIRSKAKIESIIKALKSKNPPKHFNPNKNALKELGIDLPLSKNGTSVDFKNTKYLYPIKGTEKNIVKIKLTGKRRWDDKLAYELSGIKKNKNYTWHHLDDYDHLTNTCSMQLVMREIHEATVPHYGAVEIVKRFFNIEKYN